MNDIAPKTTPSDRAASHGPKRHARPRVHGACESVPPAASKPIGQASPSPSHPAPPAMPKVAELDEGDILLHVLGTGLGPEFCAFVCEVAMKLRLRGWSRCESGALTLRAVGREPELAALVHEIRLHAPADCNVRAIEPDAGDGGAPLPDHGFIPITGDYAAAPLATGTTAGSGPDW